MPRTVRATAFLYVFVAACGSTNRDRTTNPDPVPAATVAQDVRAASVKFQPIEPVSFADQFASKPNVPPCHNIDGDDKCSDVEILANFPNDATQVAVFQLDASGEVKAPFVTSSGRGNVYRVIVDYVKFRTDSLEDCIFQSGIGIRLKAELTTTSAKADISSPIGIGLSAQLGRVRGSLSFETIGVSGKSITPLVPIPSQISAESIQKAIEAASSIKAVLYSGTADGDVVVEPQVFALKCRETKPSDAIVPPPDRGMKQQLVPTPSNDPQPSPGTPPPG